MNRDGWLVLLVVAVVGVVGVAFFSLAADTEDNGIKESSDAVEAESRPVPVARRTSEGPSLAAKVDEPGPATNLTSGHPSPVNSVDAYGVKTAVLYGQVLGIDNEPLADVDLKLMTDLSDRVDFFMSGETFIETRSDAAGKFEIRHIPTYENFAIRATHQDLAPRQIERLVFRPGDVKELEIRMSKGLSLKGRVEDEDGQPIEGARVLAQDLKVAVLDPLRGVERETVSDVDGRFALSGLSGGQKNLLALKIGYATASRQNFVLESTEAASEHRLIMKAGFTIQGRVLNEDRQPVQGAFVSAAWVSVGGAEVNDGVYLPVISGDDGVYTLAGLPHGVYVIRASLDGGASEARRNAQSGATDIDLVISNTPVVKGQVVDDETGEPLKAFQIVSSPTERLLNRSKQRSKRFETSDGHFVFPLRLVPPGTRRVWLFALHPAFAGGSTEVVLIPEDRSVLNQPKVVDGVVIRVRRGASLTGKVQGWDGMGLPQARVLLVPHVDEIAGAGPLLSLFQRTAASDTSSVFTRDDGHFVLAGALGGRYRLKIEHKEHATLNSDLVLDVPASGEIDAGVFRLNRGGVVRGIVRDQDKKPEEGARVVLSPQDLKDGEGYSMMTGLTGEYLFPNVKPGMYTIAVAERKGLSPLAILFASGALSPQQNMTILVEEGGVVERDF